MNENKLGPISWQRSFNLLFIRGEYLVGEVGEERDGQAKVVSVRLNKIVPEKHPFSGTKKTFQSYLYRTLFSGYIVLYCM